MNNKFCRAELHEVQCNMRQMCTYLHASDDYPSTHIYA